MFVSVAGLPIVLSLPLDPYMSQMIIGLCFFIATMGTNGFYFGQKMYYLLLGNQPTALLPTLLPCLILNKKRAYAPTIFYHLIYPQSIDIPARRWSQRPIQDSLCQRKTGRQTDQQGQAEGRFGADKLSQLEQFSEECWSSINTGSTGLWFLLRHDLEKHQIRCEDRISHERRKLRNNHIAILPLVLHNAILT